jgi:hypothetical protein
MGSHTLTACIKSAYALCGWCFLHSIYKERRHNARFENVIHSFNSRCRFACFCFSRLLCVN